MMSSRHAGKTPNSDPQESREVTAAKSRISQADVPGYSLEQALRIPKAIGDNYAYKPTKPLNVAAAIQLSPSSGNFRGLTGAAIAYGLTLGGYNAPEIKLEPLAFRILRPLQEGDDLTARREAMLKPRVFREFLEKYNNASLPREDIARNVLTEMGVPSDRAVEVLQLILESASGVGFIRDIKGKQYIDLQGSILGDSSEQETPDTRQETERKQEPPESIQRPLPSGLPPSNRALVGGAAVTGSESHESNRRRVFITHGKNKAFVEPIKKLLAFGELEPVVSVEKQSVSVPVPDKVMSDMRSCGAAIIHVDVEQKLIDSSANEYNMVNPNVLIEIGAAMALYGRRFILLVKDGVSLPSNLQGLYEVRYRGDAMDGEATIRLLEAINDIKNHPLPLRYAGEGSSSS